MNSLIMQSSKPNQISWGTDVAEDVQLDEEKLKEALRKQKEFESQAVETNERKRKYNSFKDDGAAPTEEEASALPMLLALTMPAAVPGVWACLPGMLQQPTLPRCVRAGQTEPTELEQPVIAPCSLGVGSMVSAAAACAGSVIKTPLDVAVPASD